MRTLDVVESIYFAALEKKPEERAAYLDQACAGDPKLRVCVERMLGGAAGRRALPGAAGAWPATHDRPSAAEREARQRDRSVQAVAGAGRGRLRRGVPRRTVRARPPQ